MPWFVVPLNSVFVTLCKNVFIAGLADFWKTSEDSYLVHRGYIAVSDKYTLLPKNKTECEKQEVKCSMKQETEVKNVKKSDGTTIPGSCENGWSITDTEIWNSSTTKIVCETKAEARWHFYVFPLRNPKSYNLIKYYVECRSQVSSHAGFFRVFSK